MSWSYHARIRDGEVVDVMKSGDVPEEFTITVQGHVNEGDGNVTVATSVTLIDKVPDAKEVKPE